MAVETRYVVVRNEGKEVMTFTDKKSADEYDRMLDMAEGLTSLLENAPLKLDDNTKEELSIYLAKQRDEVLYALQAKKRPADKSAKAKSKSEEGKQPQADSSDKANSAAAFSDSATVTDIDIDDKNEADDAGRDFVIEKEDAA